MSDFKGGYTGRTLRVNLTTQTLSVEETPDPARWLGARGWNALVGWNEVGPGVGPFDAENRLVFSAGPLVGTHAPTSGRVVVSSIAPCGYPTPMWSAATMGGYWGAELKYAGYDSVIIQGEASAPCYLLIENDKASLQDASDLWGEGAYTAQERLKERHSAQHQVVAIGPAGENRVRFAAIVHRRNNVVGNGGLGGVMGAKKLKAIAVRGTGGVCLADPAGFTRAVAEVWRMAKGGIGRIGQLDAGFPLIACTHACSVKCGTRARWPETATGSTPLTVTTCNDSSFIGGSHTGYEGTSFRGESLVVPRPAGLGQPGFALANLVNDLGLSSWVHSTWGRYFGALEQLGIHEVLGQPLQLDSAEWWRGWLLDLAHRRGLGNEYAEGFSRFYEQHPIGPAYLAEMIESAGSRGHGWHREGRSMEKHPSPFWEYAALLYAVSTRDVTPSTHDFFFLNGLYGYPSAPKAPEEISPQLQELAVQLYGSAEAVHPGDAYIEQVTFLHQHRAIIKDSLALCDWVFPLMRRGFENEAEMKAYSGPIYGDMAAEATLLRPCTGLDLSIAEMESPIAERIINLERCMEIRNNGRGRAEDEQVIPHFQWPEKTDGTHISPDAHEFRALLERYYTLRGWDTATGHPTRARLVQLGLGDVAASLYGEGPLTE
jgi:aldehyde:ferredoxin oxidoreductase